MMRPLALLVSFAAAIAALAAPSVKASIVQAPGANPGEFALTVRLQPMDLTLGSYQGTLHFAPGSLTIIAASTPKGDGTRVVNVADSAKGTVRFAGFTVSGFNTTDVLTLLVRPARKLENAALQADLQVAGDINGVSVPKERLIPARGISPDPGP